MEKRDKYRAAKGQVIFIINKYVDDFNREYIKVYIIAKAR